MENTDFWISAVKVYFDILYKLNINYIKLIGTEKFDIRNEFIYDSIADEISKLIPISINETSKIAFIRSQKENDGIIDLLGNNFEFVKDTHKRLVEENNETLYNIKSLRNRIEHSPHRLMGYTGISSNGLVDITFGYLSRNKKYPATDFSSADIDNYRCNSNDIEKIIIELNILFSKIQEEMSKEFDKNDAISKQNRIYKECINIDYKEFNKIYNNKDFDLFCKLVNKSIMRYE